jgi:hypothetical protein
MRETTNLTQLHGIYTDPSVFGGIIVGVLAVAALGYLSWELCSSLVKPLIKTTTTPTLAPPVLVVPAPSPLPPPSPSLPDNYTDLIRWLVTKWQEIYTDPPVLPGEDLIVGVLAVAVVGYVGWGLYKWVKPLIIPPTSVPVLVVPAPSPPVLVVPPAPSPPPPPPFSSLPEDFDDYYIDWIYWLIRLMLAILLNGSSLVEGASENLNVRDHTYNFIHVDDDVIDDAERVVRRAHHIRLMVNMVLPAIRPYVYPYVNEILNEAYRPFLYGTQVLVDLLQIHTGVYHSFFLFLAG